MKTIYSILYVPISTNNQEKISIGLLMSNGEDYRFKFSPTKLKFLNTIISSQSYSLLKSYLNSIDEQVNYRFNNIFEETSNWVSKDYLSYLSKYSNNLIEYSEPIDINVELNTEVFNIFFSKFIFKEKEEVQKKNRQEFFRDVKLELNSKIEERVNIDLQLTSKHLENLFTPVKVDFVGINGRPVAGQFFDFEKSNQHLNNDITKYVSLSTALDKEKGTEGKYFVIGKEPDKNIHSINHSLWKHIKDTKFLEFIHAEETDIVTEYMHKSDVRPLFEK